MEAEPRLQRLLQPFLQGVRQSLGTAEPNLRIVRASLCGTQMLGREDLALPGAVHPQAHARKRRTQGLQSRHETVRAAVAGAVVEIRLRRLFRMALQGFEP